MNYKNYSIDDRFINVITADEYASCQDIYPAGSAAIEKEKDGTTYYLPIRSTTDSAPGFYPAGNCVAFTKYPEVGDNTYSDPSKLVDFSNTKDMKELMDKQNQFRDLEYEMLCTPGDVLVAPYLPTDTPLMRGFKEAINAKGIVAINYKERMGANYSNDIRKVKEDDITIKMASRMAKSLDEEMILIIRDTSPDVANPIGREIVINITGGGDVEEGE